MKIGYVVAALLVMATSPASASKSPVVALDDLVAQSASIVRARVLAVDRSDGGKRDARTLVSLDVQEVLRGTDQGKHVEIQFVGGELPNGSGMWPSGLPSLEPGQTYLLFFRDKYYLSPLLNTKDSALRILKVEDAEVVVDAQGRALTIHPTHGLIRGELVAPPLAELRPTPTVNTKGEVASGPSTANGGITPPGLQGVVLDSTPASTAATAPDRADIFVKALRDLSAQHAAGQSAIPRSPEASSLLIVPSEAANSDSIAPSDHTPHNSPN